MPPRSLGTAALGDVVMGAVIDATGRTDAVFTVAAAACILGAIATALLAGFTDSDGNVWKMVIVSRSHSQLTVNPCTVEANWVISAQVRHNPGAMKRRKTRSVY